MNYPGDTVRITGEFRARTTGTLTDPTTVTLYVMDPDGDETSYTYAAAEVTKDGTGLYHYDLAVPDEADSEGTWYYKWKITGTLAGVTEGSFKVRDSQFAS